MKATCNIFLFLFFVFGVHAQNLKDDFLKINKKYKECKKISMQMTYQIYVNHTATAPFQTQSGEMKKNDNLVTYKIGPLEMLKTERFEIVLDHDEQFIAMMEHQTQEFEWDEKLYLGSIDNVLKHCQSNDYTEEKNIGCYDFKMKTSEYSRVKIFFDKKTFYITKMVLYYKNETILNEDGVGKKEKPRLEITYDKINDKPVFEANTFSEEKYVVKSANTYKCIEKYKNYTLSVNFLNDVIKKNK